MKMTSLLWCHMYIEHSQSVQYFAHSVTTCQVLNTIASYEYQENEHIQQWILFKCQISAFYFSTHHPDLFKHLLICRSDCVRDLTAAITSSVVKTTHRPGLFVSTALSTQEISELMKLHIQGVWQIVPKFIRQLAYWFYFHWICIIMSPRSDYILAKFDLTFDRENCSCIFRMVPAEAFCFWAVHQPVHAF